MSIRFAYLILAIACASSPGQSPTLLEASFETRTGANDDVFALDRDNNGLVLIAGQFTAFNNVPRGRLVRVGANAAVDTGFFNGPGANNNIYAIAHQPDGKVLIGGTFTEVHGQPRSYLARLQPDGQLDSDFQSVVINNELRCISVLPDARILIAGRFTQVDGQNRGRIAFLNSDGSLDTTFDPGSGANDNIRTLIRLGDGRLLIGGQFTSYNGNTARRIARLLETGALDSTFNAGQGANNQVRAIATNSAGQIYIGGDFSSYDGVSRSGVARLHPDGGLDLGFDQGISAGTAVRALSVQPDNKVWIGGAFTTAGGQYRQNIARLLTDGTADTFFEPATVVNQEIFAFHRIDSEHLLIAGEFTRVDDRIARKVAMLLPELSLSVFSFTYATIGVDEPNGIAAIGVRRSGSLGLPASTTVLVRNGSAVNGLDFLSGTGRAEFAAGQTLGTVEFPILDDPFAEGDEWFEIELVNPAPPNGLTNQLQQVWINDNEFPNSIDTVFEPESYHVPILSVAVTPDRRMIVGGAFHSVGGCLGSFMGRLNTNGTTDCGFFVNSSGANMPVHAVALQTNGYILAGGAFTFFNAVPAHHLVRLKEDGVPDPNFQAGINLNGTVHTVTVLPDGNILIGGQFTAFGETRRSGLARLHPDGSLDDSFNPAIGPIGFVRSIRLAADGRLLIAGEFTYVNGLQRPGVARLNPDGSLDSSFAPSGGPDGPVYAVAEQPDGRILIGGNFTEVSGQPRSKLARLRADGVLDSDFNAGLISGGATVNAIAIQPGGKVLIGGAFTAINTIARSKIARLHPNGDVDDAFLPSSGANRDVFAIQILTSGQILVAGAFTEIGGVQRPGIAILESTPKPGRIELLSDRIIVDESASSVGVQLRRTGVSDHQVTVQFTTFSDTAMANDDFVPASGWITFAPLQTRETIGIALVNDGIPETTEQFRIRLHSPQDGTVLGIPYEAVIVVTDGDAGIGVTAPQTNFREGVDGVATFLISRNTDGPDTLSVDFSTVDGTARAGSDYISTNGTLTFLPGEMQKTILVTLLTNPEFEGPEWFQFTLSNPTGPGGLATNHLVTAFIEDQDGVFAIESVNPSSEEYWSLIYVSRRGPVAMPASVRIRSVAGSATPGEDFIPIDQVLEFTPGQLGWSGFYVTNLNDGLFEGTETYGLILSEPTGNSIIGEDGTADVPIFDNDRGIEFIAANFYANEFSQNAKIVVRRGDDGTNTLTVNYSTDDETAIAGADYLHRSGTLALPPGETSATFFVPIIQDQRTETNESFTVTLSSTGPAGRLDTQSVTRVVILDDERPGSLDLGFLVAPETISPYGPYSAPILLSAHSGNRLMIGARSGLARIGYDGRFDTNFLAYPSYYFFAPVSLQRPDGRIYVGGSSSNSFGGAGSYCLRLLETNGTLVPNFAFAINSGRTATIALQNDGKVIIGGDLLQSSAGGYLNRSLLRVLPGGEIDPDFTPATFDRFNAYYIAPSTVEAVAIQPDGRILAAGTFVTVNGQTRQNLVRFESNGELDATFVGPTVQPSPDTQPFPGPGSHFDTLAIDPAGRIYVGGAFTNLGGSDINNLARLLPDGTLDTTFSSPLASSNIVAAIALQPDGKLVVAVGQLEGSYYGLPFSSFVTRLLPDGMVDPDFDPGIPPDGNVTDLILLPGGDIAIGGGFTHVNGIYRPLVARLKGDGLKLSARRRTSDSRALDLFNTWPDGTTVLERSENLIHWFPVQTNTATGPSQSLDLPFSPADTFYRARHLPPAQ